MNTLLDFYDKDYNIIGIYKLSKCKLETKEAPWAHFKNETTTTSDDESTDVLTINEEESRSTSNGSNGSNENFVNMLGNEKTRDNGFSILSNRDNVVKYLKKTKFCQIMIAKGECKRQVCYFAHSLSEIIFPECAFGMNCKKQDQCTFKHPHENNEDYKSRIQFTVPPNIHVE
jgi:hypothetical protein